MEGNGLSGRMFPHMGGEMLGLEMTLHPPHATPQNTLQDPQISLQKHPRIMTFSHEQQHDQQTQLSMRQSNYPFNAPNQNPSQRSKNPMNQLGGHSDDDEQACTHDENNFDGKRKNVSPWHRMKWTDNMVRLLIVALFYMEDEAGSDLGSDKKKPGNGGGLMQKKGKWKSVSKAMMEKGFFVSPQQCEDKFNDLNKRYKRVTDILGKGTACKVVENQSLLETMDLSPKLKEEVRKLLSSKHLLFKEMCAYHNSCGHGTVRPTTDTASPASGDTCYHPQQQQVQQQQQQSCFHSSSSTQMPPSSTVPTSSKLQNYKEEDDDDNSDNDDDEFDLDDNEFNHEEEEHDERVERKRAKTTGDISSNTLWAVQKLNGEMICMLQDVSKTPREKKQWLLNQLVKLEEKGVKFQYEGLELEKQKLKWIKFSCRKEREMEMMKIDNEKKRLENERMVLLLRQKEIELLFLEQHPNSNPSCVTG